MKVIILYKINLDDLVIVLNDLDNENKGRLRLREEELIEANLSLQLHILKQVDTTYTFNTA